MKEDKDPEELTYINDLTTSLVRSSSLGRMPTFFLWGSLCQLTSRQRKKLRKWQGKLTLAWKIPWMEEPGRLQSMGSLRVGQD